MLPSAPATAKVVPSGLVSRLWTVVSGTSTTRTSLRQNARTTTGTSSSGLAARKSTASAAPRYSPAVSSTDTVWLSSPASSRRSLSVRCRARSPAFRQRLNLTPQTRRLAVAGRPVSASSRRRSCGPSRRRRRSRLARAARSRTPELARRCQVSGCSPRRHPRRLDSLSGQNSRQPLSPPARHPISPSTATRRRPL